MIIVYNRVYKIILKNDAYIFPKLVQTTMPSLSQLTHILLLKLRTVQIQPNKSQNRGR